MKILIGTPIHRVKDYCMERWLENVARLQSASSADLLLVDNSPGLDYMGKVKGYCAKYGMTSYKIKHLEIPQEQKMFERVARCREVIRQYLLSKRYDAWFSWECDQIIPINALDKLVRLMNTGDFVMVSHNNWTREIPDLPNFDWGVALIKRQVLEKYSFILEFGTDPDMPDTWEPGEAWFRKRILRSGDSFLEADGVINPIHHLKEP
ncbi:hypothetical protein HYT32_01965 [Candidatus Roizmanbacteria bacterium]|nr:hypothetical protein [Candidatus Roizmanbacteria bacterium]